VELSKLQELLTVLRQYGVTSYAAGDLSLTLAAASPAATSIDNTVRADNARADSMDPALKQALRRIDPQYADSALFEVVCR
jgi:hypothetical protein